MFPVKHQITKHYTGIKDTTPQYSPNITQNTPKIPPVDVFFRAPRKDFQVRDLCLYTIHFLFVLQINSLAVLHSAPCAVLKHKAPYIYDKKIKKFA